MFESMIEDGIKQVVFGVLHKQFKVSGEPTNYYAHYQHVSPITQKEYKRLRRGVRWVFTRAGMTKITDRQLIKILKSEGVGVVE